VLVLISCTQTKDGEANMAQNMCDCQKFVNDYDSVATEIIHPELSDSVNYSNLQEFYTGNQEELDDCATLVDQEFESRIEILRYFRSVDLECE
ncbi:MAG: hypothetical protein HRT57_00750, partial [Crocinitomicaceae bacterium]|nr:hypothetical protein [Crocinitomicaceae bacterium]